MGSIENFHPASSWVALSFLIREGQDLGPVAAEQGLTQQEGGGGVPGRAMTLWLTQPVPTAPALRGMSGTTV